MAEITSLAQGIALLNQMEQALSPDAFLAWLDARPGSELVYRTFVLDSHIEQPTEPEITPETTLIQAFPGLAKHYGKPLPQQHRPNGDARYGYL